MPYETATARNNPVDAYRSTMCAECGHLPGGFRGYEDEGCECCALAEEEYEKKQSAYFEACAEARARKGPTSLEEWMLDAIEWFVYLSSRAMVALVILSLLAFILHETFFGSH